MTDYPQWVRERACELANKCRNSTIFAPYMVGRENWAALTALADLILKYETAPVDPDLLIAREVVAEYYAANPSRTWNGREPSEIIGGSIDDGPEVKQSLRAIRLARERNAL